MVIESSEVKISSHSKSSFEMISQSQVDFRNEVLGFMVANEDNKGLESDGYNEAVDEPTTKSTQDASEVEKENNMRLFDNFRMDLLMNMFSVFFLLNDEEKKSMHSLKDLTMPGQSMAVDVPKMLVKNSVSIERSYEYSRSDSIEFSTQATIKTKDKDINIDLDFSYSREFYEKHSEKIVYEETHFIDPLVIQYDCDSSAFDTLSDKMCFNFDINSDGKEKELPLLKDGSGFLVLDKNANGIIDDGSELFGPSTNDGFGELSQYDGDGNNWIDENDSIFKDLRIWAKNESGSESLIALGQSGIGALYLGDVGADMAYNKSANESLAYLKSNSIFLREDGTAGIISSFDFKS